MDESRPRLSPAFDQWISFTFGLNGRPSLVGMDPFPWDAQQLAGHCLTFFHHADAILAGIPHALAAPALWQFPGIDGYLGIASHPAVPGKLRESLIRAHKMLFTGTFPTSFFGEAFMWWEHLQGASYEDGPVVSTDPAICSVVLEVLESILDSPSEACQMSALHGIAEFGYEVVGRRGVENIVSKFMNSTVAKTPGVLKYALDVASDNVL